jgi:hypothetical protein
MRDKCIDAVKAAAGRSLTQAEIKDIEDRIKRNQRQLAQKDRSAYLSLTPEQRLQEAGKLAAQELVAEASKKKQRVALTIQKHDAINNYLSEHQARYGASRLDGLSRVLAFNSDQKVAFTGGSVETRSRAIAHDYIRQLVETFEAVEPRIFGLFTNRDGIRALTYELFGQDSRGVVEADTAAVAKKAAAKWSEVAESARRQWNNAGGETGRLEDWRMPQTHSQFQVAKAGADQWAADVFGKLDRRRYVREDGSMMDDAEVMEFLREAWTTIATGGANKVEPGRQSGKGMRAKRNAEARSIHFKDADGYLEYQAKYGGADAYTAMMQHITGMADDIAVVETFGPNPDLQFKYWLETAVKEDKLADPKRAGKVDARAESLSNLYDFVAGRTQPVASQRLAEGFDTLRNWLVATRLGSAFITSITDNATLRLTAAVNNLPQMQLLRNQMATLNPANREELRMARRAGLSLNTLIGEMNRWGAESLGPSFSSKMASLNIRVSGLNAATEARRRAFGVTMYGSIGSTVKRAASLAKVAADDRALLESKGVTEQVFSAWKKAKLEDWGGGNDTMLTPEAIYKIADPSVTSEMKREAALKLLGMVDEEINMAVIEPGARDRSMLKMGLQRGTWKGEIMRSFFLFKSFPIAMMTRHLNRGLTMPTGTGKAAYLAALMAGTTILGAAAQQVSQVVAGKDPQDMNAGTFWAGAFLKGGSLGIYGDFLLNTNTQYGSSPLATLSGPVAGYVEEVIGLTQGNLMKAAKGEKTHAGAEAIRFFKSNIPLQNLWYTKAATDRLVFNQLQEMVSPGYLARVESRARRDFGQSYYWRPGEMSPSRPPDIEAAFGKK